MRTNESRSLLNGGNSKEVYSKREKIESVERSLNIIKIISESKSAGITAADLQRRTKIPKSSLSYLLRTLVKNNFLSFSKESKRYSVGRQILSLGAEIAKELRQIWETIEISKEDVLESLKSISQQTKLVALCGVLSNEELVFIESYTVPGNKVNILPGERKTPYKSALGRILLAHLNEKQFHKMMEKNPVGKPGVDREISTLLLHESLLGDKKAGYSVYDEEEHDVIRTVAAPLLTVHSEAVAAIGVIGTAEQIEDPRLLGKVIKNEANSLSMQVRIGERSKFNSQAGLDRAIHTVTQVGGQRYDLDKTITLLSENNAGDQMNELQRELYMIRLDHGMTQSQLAETAGLSQPFIAKLESGRLDNIELKTLIRIVSALNRNIEVRFKKSSASQNKITAKRNKY